MAERKDTLQREFNDMPLMPKPPTPGRIIAVIAIVIAAAELGIMGIFHFAVKLSP